MALKFGPGGPKEFLAQHGEKFGLAAIVVVFALLVYRGYQVEGLPSGRDPDGLKQLVETARQTAINTDMSEQLITDRVPDLNYQAKVEESRRATDPNPYQPRQPWTPLPPSLQTKRSDPKLLKPIKVEVTGVFAAVAERRKTGEVDALAELPAAPPRKVEAVAERSRPKPTTRRTRTPRGEEDFMPETDEAMTGMGAMYGEETAGRPSGSVRYLASKFTRGWFRLGGSGTTSGFSGEETDRPAGGNTTTAVAPATPANSVPRTRPFNAVSAVFPFERQGKEYEQALQEAQGYQRGQDIPRIVFFEAQRVDVTDDPARVPDESEWKLVTNTTHQYNLQQQLAGSPAELVDPKFVDPNITMPLPPVLMQKIEPIALHSETPKFSRVRETREAAEGDEAQREGPQSVLDDFPGDTLPGPAVGPGGARPGAMPPGGRRPGMPAPGGQARQSVAPRFGEEDEGVYAEGSYRSPGTGSGQEVAFPEYKLVRFYDFARVEPGRKYRYRVRLWLEDPNRPANPDLAPPHQILDDVASARVRQVEAEDAKKTNHRTYWRTTEWSDPSAVASVEVPKKLYVGSVTRPKTYDIKVNNLPEPLEVYRAATDEVEGDLVSVIWGGRTPERNQDLYPTFIPAEGRVRRGSVLSFKTDAEVVHPFTHQIKLIEEYPFHSNTIVVDIRGGEALPGGDKDAPLTAPGEFALIDDDGNFIVRNELDTIEGFRMYTFAYETERAGPTRGVSDGLMQDAGDGFGGILDTEPRSRGGRQRGRGD